MGGKDVFGWRSEGGLTGSPPMTVTEAARSLAIWGFAGGLVGLISLALPHAEGRNEIVLLILNGSIVALGVAVFAAPERWPAGIVRTFPTLAVATTTLGVIFTGDPITPIAIFFLWAPIHALMFLSRGEFIWTFAFTSVAAIAVFALVGGPEVASTAERVRALLCGAATLIFICTMLIYQRVRMERASSALASAGRTDLLTGVPNSRGLNEALARELATATVVERRVSVVRVSLDHFRTVNERVGHERGDDVLSAAAELFRALVGPRGVVGRSGGSEFTLILPGRSESEAYLLSEQLRARLRELAAAEIGLTASVGIATFPIHASTPEELVKVAGRALAAAKRTGRDRTVIFSGEISDVLAHAGADRGSRNASLATLVSVVDALELRGAATRKGHGARVGAYAEAIARELGMSEYQSERVRLAGALHEIGNVGVSEAILEKHGPLSEEEARDVRMHPEIAARILGASDVADIREWLLASRERPDGSGYPRGLRGQEIPLEAKIVAVADAYDAMRRSWPYREAREEETARAELAEHAGEQFDAEVVAALERVVARAGSALTPVA